MACGGRLAGWQAGQGHPAEAAQAAPSSRDPSSRAHSLAPPIGSCGPASQKNCIRCMPPGRLAATCTAPGPTYRLLDLPLLFSVGHLLPSGLAHGASLSECERLYVRAQPPALGRRGRRRRRRADGSLGALLFFLLGLGLGLGGGWGPLVAGRLEGLLPVGSTGCVCGCVGVGVGGVGGGVGWGGGSWQAALLGSLGLARLSLCLLVLVPHLLLLRGGTWEVKRRWGVLHLGAMPRVARSHGQGPGPGIHA